MTRKKKDKRYADFLFYLALFLASFVFLAVFSYFTSPFTNCNNGNDAAFFRLVGQGMTKGYLPYRDFFDMKGPYLFFIEYFGQILSYGRKGIFLIQWINLFVSFVIISKLFELYQIKNRLLEFVLMLPIAYIASFTFEGGNLTEEFSLVPLLSCMYLCAVFFEKGERYDSNKFYWRSSAWFGFCFGFLLMIRITNAALICAMVITVALYLIKNKKMKQLFICEGSFILGVIVALCPAILFFWMKDLLSEMLEAVFVLGFKYSGEKTFIQHVVETLQSDRNQQLLLIAIPCFVPIILHWKGWRERFLVFVGSVFTFLSIASGNNYTHYYTLTIPLLVLCEIAVVNSFHEKNGKRAVFAAILTAVMFISQLSIMLQYLYSAYLHLFQPGRFDTEQLVQDISTKIPEEDHQSVFCYNINPNWYTYADLFPCIKYCGWQNHYIALMPEIYDDLQFTFSVNPPAWLLEEMLNSNTYQLAYQNSSYALYHFSG